jgi:hypothetical protein
MNNMIAALDPKKQLSNYCTQTKGLADCASPLSK